LGKDIYQQTRSITSNSISRIRYLNFFVCLVVIPLKGTQQDNVHPIMFFHTNLAKIGFSIINTRTIWFLWSCLYKQKLHYQHESTLNKEYLLKMFIGLNTFLILKMIARVLYTSIWIKNVCYTFTEFNRSFYFNCYIDCFE